MEQIQNQGSDPNEKSQEEELLEEPKADELRTSIATKLGLDNDIDSDLLDKLVADKIEDQKKLSTAIKQKRHQREEKEALLAKIGEKKEDIPQPPQPKVQEFEKVLDQKLNEKLEEQALESLDLSDELRLEVKTYAKAKGLSIKQASNSEYIKWLKEQADIKQKVEEASLGGKRRAQTQRDLSALKPDDFDLSTEEGRKDYEEFKRLRKEKS